MSYQSWAERARETIQAVHATLPAAATYDERKAALFDAYPFGMRQYHPYKMWLKEQKKYLQRYDPKWQEPKHLSPLERLMQKAPRP